MKVPRFTRFGIFALTLVATASSAADFHAGAGKGEVEITPAMLPLEGLTSQHDPLTVRALLMDDGSHRTAIVVLEQPSISSVTVAEVKALLAKTARVSADNAIVVGTHTTSAPHANIGGPGGPGGPTPQPARAPDPKAISFAAALIVAADRAISQAAASLQNVTVSFGVAATDANINRDLPTPRGWAFGSNAAGFSDRSVPVVRFNRTDGKPLAVILNAAVRSVVMDGSIDDGKGGKAITADLAGASARYIESWYGGSTVALFLMGAGVDQSPALEANRSVLASDGSQSRIDLREEGFTLLTLLGERLGSEVIQAAETAQPLTAPTTDVNRTTLQLPSQGRAGGPPSNTPVLSYAYATGPEIVLPVVFLRLGDIVIVGVQPELGSSIGAQIKTESPFPHTLVVSMVDGGAKYMVDAQSYDRFTSEARGSQFARGAAAIAVQGIVEELRRMKAAASK